MMMMICRLHACAFTCTFFFEVCPRAPRLHAHGVCVYVSVCAHVHGRVKTRKQATHLQSNIPSPAVTAAIQHVRGQYRGSRRGVREHSKRHCPSWGWTYILLCSRDLPALVCPMPLPPLHARPEDRATKRLGNKVPRACRGVLLNEPFCSVPCRRTGVSWGGGE